MFPMAAHCFTAGAGSFWIRPHLRGHPDGRDELQPSVAGPSPLVVDSGTGTACSLTAPDLG